MRRPIAAGLAWRLIPHESMKVVGHRGSAALALGLAGLMFVLMLAVVVYSTVELRRFERLESRHAVVVHPDPASLLRDLAAALRDHLRIEYLSFALLDPAAGQTRLQLLQPIDPTRAPDPADTPTQLPAGESPTATIVESQEPIWLSVDVGDPRFPTLSRPYIRSAQG